MWYVWAYLYIIYIWEILWAVVRESEHYDAKPETGSCAVIRATDWKWLLFYADFMYLETPKFGSNFEIKENDMRHNAPRTWEKQLDRINSWWLNIILYRCIVAYIFMLTCFCAIRSGECHFSAFCNIFYFRILRHLCAPNVQRRHIL